MPIDQHLRHVIHDIVVRLADLHTAWSLIGSANLALQGVEVGPRDIDLLTTLDGAYLIEGSMQEFVLSPVAWKETRRFAAHRGELRISGVQVEVLGGLENRIPPEDLWTERHGLSARTWLADGGLRIPVMPLTQELHAYIAMGKLDTAEKIRAALSRQSRH